MQKVLIRSDEIFKLSVDQRKSFQGAPTPYRLSGPQGFMRLMERTGHKEGAYWFEDQMFLRLRDQTKRHLIKENGGKLEPFARPMKEIIGMSMRLCLRQDLAIRKDWTENFDGYALLALRPIDSVVAWVGLVAAQPYYSPPDPKKLMTKEERARQQSVHDLAESSGVSLLGGVVQYVIDFKWPANQAATRRIEGPREF